MELEELEFFLQNPSKRNEDNDVAYYIFLHIIGKQAAQN